MYLNIAKALFYRFSYQIRGFWVLIPGLAFRWTWGPLYRIETTPTVALAVNVVILTLLAAGVLLWLPFARWFNVYYRHLAYFAARWLGGLFAWSTSGWRGALLLVTVVAAGFWAHAFALAFLDPANKLPPKEFVTAETALEPLKELLTAGTVLRILAVAFLVALLRDAYRTRRRLVVTAPTDYARDAELAPVRAGLAARLTEELVGLSNLYRAIDETRPGLAKEEKPQPLNPSITVQDVSPSLENAVSAESKVKIFGLVEVPVAPALTLSSRLLRGPRLACALHIADGQPLLTAKFTAAGRSESWRVGVADLDGPVPPSRAAAIEQMLAQLAFRIFTDLNNPGSPRWRAVRAYSAGLQAYLRSQRSPRRHDALLRLAEGHFIQALAEDREFASCFYNLGVVYREQLRLDSARAAFVRATAVKPDLDEAYYALAEAAWGEDDDLGTILHCDRCIALRPDDATAWNLKGLALRRLAEAAESRHEKAGKIWANVYAHSTIAAALAWRALVRRTWRRESRNKAPEVARACLRSLAMISGTQGRWFMGSVFQQAMALDPHDATLAAFYGQVLVRGAGRPGGIRAFLGGHRSWRAGNDAYLRSLQIRSDARIWAELADAQLSRVIDPPRSKRRAALNEARIAAARAASKEAVNGCWGLPPQVLRRIWRLARKSRADHMLPYLALAHDVLDRTTTVRRSETPAACNTRLLRLADKPGRSPSIAGRIHANVAWRLWGTDVTAARSWMERAVGELKSAHPLTDRTPYFHELMSQCHRQLGDHTRALPRAERAVALQPQDPRWRKELARTLIALEDLDAAERQAKIAVDLDPFDVEPLQLIADIYLSRGFRSSDRDTWQVACATIIRLFEDALALVERRDPSLDLNVWAERIGQLHYWLGVFHGERHAFPLASAHLQTAIGLGYKPLEGRVANAEAYLLKGADSESVQACREAIREAHRHRRRVGRRLDEPMDAPGEFIPIGEVIAEAHYLIAVGRIDRRLDLPGARRRLLVAAGHLDHVRPGERRAFEAKLTAAAAWADACAGFPLEAPVRGAVERLERAVTRTAEVRAEVYLASAYAALALIDRIGRDQWRAKALAASQRARRRDLNDDFRERLDELDRGASSGP